MVKPIAELIAEPIVQPITRQVVKQIVKQWEEFANFAENPENL